MSKLTQKAIKAEMLKELNARPFDKITVKDLTENCGISRNTFYYHYHDTYQVLEEILDDDVERYKKAEKTFDSVEEAVLAACALAMENRKAILHLFNSDSNRQWVESYFESMIDYIVNEYVKERGKGKKIDARYIRELSNFYKYGIIGLVKAWIAGGMKNDFLETVGYLSVLLDGSVVYSLEKAQIAEE